MGDAVFERCIAIISNHENIKTVDITGGAPEGHPRFRELVENQEQGTLTDYLERTYPGRWKLDVCP